MEVLGRFQESCCHGWNYLSGNVRSCCAATAGIEKTYHRAQQRFFWPGMKRDVRGCVNSCSECPKRKGTLQKHRDSLTTWQASHPFWQISMDVMGPLPDSQGCRYILLIGDQFSRWYEAVGLPNQEAKTVTEALVEKWITRFVCPVNLHSDTGRNFMSELFRELVVFWVYKERKQLRVIRKEMQ